MSTTETPTSHPRAELTLTRVYDAPRTLVYEAWTDPKHLAAWWGPFMVCKCTVEVDLKVGGSLSITMHSANGSDYPMTGVYQEIVPNEKLVFTWQASEGPGREIAAEGLTTVTFGDEGGKTKMTVDTYGVGLTPFAEQMFRGIKQGWSESLDRLGDFSRGLFPFTTFDMSREFNAPRDLVFKMWTEVEHLKKWWGPKGVDVTEVEADIHEGGMLRCSVNLNGEAHHSRWIYKEITPPERIVFHNYVVDAEGNIIRHGMQGGSWPLRMETAFNFFEKDGKTVVYMRAFALGEDNDERAYFAEHCHNMVNGWGSTFERLEEALDEL